MTEEIRPFQMNLITMGEKLLEASLLLERWENWSKSFGSLVEGQEDFIKLQEDTKNFFKVKES